MNLNKLILFLIIFIQITACVNNNVVKISQKDEKIYYSSSGFALIYEESLYKNKIVNKKLRNKDFVVMHSFLKRNTPIKIINPVNSKVIETKIKNKANYPKIFNVLINKKIATALELDLDNPFIEIIEMKKNKTFIAKEGNIFDEEKNVADKAPVDEIKMDDLSKNLTETKEKQQKTSFILVISDFYYIDSAHNLRNDLIKKININNISIKKINNNKYRLLVGPFKNFNALKTTYISLNKLGFEGLNIYNE